MPFAILAVVCLPLRTSSLEVPEAQIAPVNDVWTTDDIRYYIESNRSLHGQNTALVMKIIECESNFNIDATNYTAVVGVDRGLFQLNDHFHPDVDYYDPKANLDYGFKLLSIQGIQPWMWSEHCWRLAI